MGVAGVRVGETRLQADNRVHHDRIYRRRDRTLGKERASLGEEEGGLVGRWTGLIEFKIGDIVVVLDVASNESEVVFKGRRRGD